MYSCGDCDTKFNSRDALRAHAEVHRASEELDPLREETHSEPNGFPCSKCDAVFKNKVALGSHQRVHPAPKPYKCQTCGSRFTMAANLLRHMKLHLKGKRPVAKS